VEHLQAALLIASGIFVIASLVFEKRLTVAQHNSLLPAHGFLAIALLVTGISWLIRGPLRVFSGPPLLVVVFVALSYGAVLAGTCLAFPRQIPKPLQALAGAFTTVAGTLLLLLQLRVIKPM
jgi:uncharacterized membrane protein YozB (DUF420 family)